MGQKINEILKVLGKICELLESLFDNTIGKISRDFKQIIIMAIKSESNTKVGNTNLIIVVCYFLVWVYSISKDKNTEDFIYLFIVIVFISLAFSHKNYAISMVNKLHIDK